MASVTSLGAGSGLELESLLTKLMQVESIPLTNLQSKAASYETKISAFGSLNSLLSKLQSAASSMATDTLEKATDKFASYTATVANADAATATATTGAVAGTYSLSVGQLATSQQLTSTGQTGGSSSVITSSAASLTLELGTLSSGGAYTSNSSVTLNLSANATLADLRDAINDGDTGVSAAIVTGTDGSHLVLTSESTGTDSVMRLSGLTGFDFDPENSATSSLSQTAAAQDAAFEVNGIAGTSTSNTVTSALDGVTLELTAQTTSATTLKISKDLTENVTSSLEAFVSAYNSAYSSMSSLGAYDADTETAGALQGNGTLRYASEQIRNLVFTTSSGTTNSKTLSDIGVSVSASGTLSIDSDKLTAALKSDPTAVADLVSNVGKTFDSKIDGLIGTTGVITVATKGLQSTVTDIEDSEEQLQTRLDAIEARYRSQFTALDSLIANLNSTGDYLTSYLSSLTSDSNN